MNGQSFGASAILLNSSTTLTFQITGSANNPVSGVSFTDTLPSGLTVSNPNGLAGNTCGQAPAAISNSGQISIINVGLNANASCSFSVNVSGITAGPQNNSVQVTSDQGTGNTAKASVAVAAPASISKGFGAAMIPVNGTTSLSFTITVPASNAASNVAFSDTLPSGLIVSSPNRLNNGCGGGMVTAVGGSGSVSYSTTGLTAGTICTISVNVTGDGTGVQNNSVTVSSDQGTSNASMASVLIVIPPTISAMFGTPTLAVGETTTLRFALSNPNTGTSLSGIGFSDPLPAGWIVATPNGLTGSCGAGTITAAAGANSVALSGGTLPTSGSCTFSLNVLGVGAGVQKTITNAVTSIEGGPGLTASASVEVLPFLNSGVLDAFQLGYASQLNQADRYGWRLRTSLLRETFTGMFRRTESP